MKFRAMVLFLSLLFLIIPLWLQMEFGVSDVLSWILLKFWQVTILCFLLEWVLSGVLFVFLDAVFPLENPYRCGVGVAGIAIFGFPISFVVLIIALIQKFSSK